ncbi:MAG TPA: GAF domain-containing sensor histidine kinase, partial [Anaerolineae bacterium]
LKGLLVEQFDIPGGAIFLYNDFADRLELWASWNLPQNVLDAFQDRSVDNSHLERVVRQHEIVFWSDFRKLDLFVRLGLDEDRPSWQSHMCVPLLAKGQIQGVLDLFSRAPAVFTRDQAVLFLTLGRQVGVAIQNARLFDEVVTKRERLRHLTQQVVKAQEEERQRVSRELHDEAGQALTALKISLDMTQATLPPRLTTARQSIAEAVALTDETMERIRLLAQDLRPPSLDHIGLNSTLEGLCHEFANRAHLSIEYEGAPLPPLPGSRAIALYRVAQEALTNVARHADASEVQVAVDYDAGSIALAVKDNGRGFNLRASKNGIGLSGMRERMELFGGRLEVNTAPGQGTEIVATLPWPEVAR